jgi:hypothetical protein
VSSNLGKHQRFNDRFCPQCAATIPEKITAPWSKIAAIADRRYR